MNDAEKIIYDIVNQNSKDLNELRKDLNSLKIKVYGSVGILLAAIEAIKHLVGKV